MKLVNLIENLAYEKKLVAEHGLSFYLEKDNLKILIDTGQSGIFIKNAEILGVNIQEIDYVIITHGHYDHTGGLLEFMRINNKAKFLIKPGAFKLKYKNDEYIGIPENITIPKERIVDINSDYQLSKSIHLFATIHTYFPEDFHNKNFYIKNNKKKESDQFDDELFVGIENNNQLIIISSCSHNGITNIIKTATEKFNLPIQLVIGGFHIRNADFKTKSHIINYMNTNDIRKIGICHCTGIDNYHSFKKHCKADVMYCYTGRIFNL